TFTPGSAAYAAYATASFTVGAGAHTVEFRGLNSAGGDNTSFVDDVRIVGSTTPATQQLAAGSFDAADVRVTGASGFSAAATAAVADDATDGVTRTVTYTVPAPAGGWSSAGASALAVEVVGGQVLTTTGAAARAGRVGTLTVGVAAPVAAAVTAPDVVAGSGNAASFTVAYVDDNPGAALPASVDSGDLRVSGPNGFNAAVTLVSTTGAGTAASPLAATYAVNPPAAGWGSAANGTYWILAQPGQVTDADGNALAAGAIGSFRVAVDTTAPLAWASESDITTAFTTDKSLEVSYYDASGINAATLAAGNVRVVGPNGWSSAVTKGTTTTGGTAAAVAYNLPARDGRWRSAHNGTYSIVLQPNQVADARGNVAANAVTIATFAVALETTPPTATAAAADVNVASTAAVTITATYADNLAMDQATFDSNDLRVTGPNGFSALAAFASTTTSGATRTVTYTLSAPSGGWSYGANGNYTIALQAGQVLDLSGNAAAAGTVGSFAVAVPVPPPPVASNLLADGGFEQPALPAGNFQYNAGGSPWTFLAGAGVTANASGFTQLNSAAPQGAQAAFIQIDGSVSQAVAGMAAGRYVVTLQAAQRSFGGGNVNAQTIDVRVDGASVGSFTPAGADYESDATAAFDLPAGDHTVSIVGLNPLGGDNTAFVDDARLTAVSPPTVPPPPVSPPPPPVAVGPTAELMSAATDAKIATLTDGYVIDLNAVGTRLNIRGLPVGTAGSIEFRIDGTMIKTETYAPYTIGGDATAANGTVDYLDWTPPAGTHTLTVLQWTGAGGTGSIAGTTTLSFTTIPVADTTPPTAAVSAVSPSPRTTPVDAVTVTFSEPVTGFDAADLTLTRDGQPVALDGVAVTPAGGNAYSVTGLTAATTPAGSYALTLSSASSGIADAAGNPLAASAAVGWTVTAVIPAPVVTGVSPASIAGSRFLRSLTVTGTDFPADATVTLRDPATGADLTGVTVVSRSATQVVVTARLGSAARQLTAEVTGSTGTSAAAGFAVTAEPPAVAAGTVDATTGKTAALNVTGASGTGVTYAWSVTAAPAGAPAVAFSANGTSAAAATTATFGRAGAYTFQVIASDGVASVTSAVTVTVGQKLTAIAVTPAAATVALGKTQQFAAAASDQFGVAMSATVGWTVASGGVGTVSAAGLYTAPATGSGSATVRATSGSVVGSATVTVPAAAAAFTSAKIHFRPSSAAGVSGYLADSGLTYAARNGLTYGWSVSHADAVVDRNKNSNQLFDTNVGVKAGAKWEILVPNGKYNVRVSIGDSAAASTNTVRLEGTSVYAAQKLAANAFATRLVTVTVTDGKLTLDAGSAASGLTRVNYLEITKV
ncbi:MAG: conserved repeat domain protein, partial [Phycisphaerales bacterium]|nr:conserved repeat domain protein [Phycisphaerales bacterium]